MGRLERELGSSRCQVSVLFMGDPNMNSRIVWHHAAAGGDCACIEDKCRPSNFRIVHSGREEMI